MLSVLINNYLDGRQACYLAYSRSSNVLYIVPDNGDATQITAVVLDGSSATGSGNTLTLVLNLLFSASFAGNNAYKVVYLAARDVSQNNSGCQTMGNHRSQKTEIRRQKSEWRQRTCRTRLAF